MMFANFRSLWLAVAACTVVFSSGCEGDTSVLLTVKGEPSRVASLFGRVIGRTGPVGPVHRFSNGEVVLPGTILIQTSASTSRLGIVLWAEDGSGKIVSQARSGVCFAVASGSQSKYQITMMPAQAGWSAAIADQCYCNETMPDLDMCPPGGIPDDIKNQQGGTSGTGTGGNGGGSGGTGGAQTNGGTGGTVPSGGTGGTTQTGGTGGNPVTGGAGSTATGGTGGTVATGGAAGAATGGTSVPVTNSLFSFDTATDWSTDGGTVAVDTAVKSQGTGSIAFTVASKTVIRSRSFATSEVPGATSKISLDVYFETAQGNQSNIQMWFECVAANVYNGYVEYKATGGIAAKTWTSVVFTMSAPVAAAFQGNFIGCKLWMDFEATGLVRFDNLGFVP